MVDTSDIDPSLSISYIVFQQRQAIPDKIHDSSSTANLATRTALIATINSTACRIEKKTTTKTCEITGSEFYTS